MDLGKRPDFESWDKKLEESDKGKPGVGIPDFESWDKKITAREEVEQRGPLGDIVSGIVRGVAVEMPSLALDIAGTTERVAREAFGFKEGPGDIEQAAQKGEESLRGFQSRHSILRPHEKPEATEEAPLLEPSGKKYGFFDKLREMTDEPSDILDYIPFVAGAKDVSEVATVAASAYKLDQGTATQEDQDRLVEFLREANKDTTFGYKVLDVVAEMPAFMGEFLLTSGIYTAGKKVGTKAATSAIKKYLGKSGEKLLKSKIGSLGLKVAGGVAGGTVQAPIMGLPRIISGTIERSMPHVRLTGDEKGELSAMVSGKGEDLIPAALKSFGDQWAETISEHSGGLFAKLGTMGKNLAIKSGLLSSFIKANPARSPGKAIKLFKSVGYHGVINEMAEERLGEVLRAGIGVTEEYNLPTAEQLGVELVAFSVPGVAQAIASHIESKGEDTETPPTDPESTETPPADFKPQEDGGTPFSPDEVLSRKDDVRNHIALAIGTGEINDNQAHELGRNIGLGLDETNQALIRGMGIQRMLKYADPLELKPFAAEQGIDVPASVTDGNQIATIIQEGLKEEGSVIAELAKQVKNLEKTAATRGMEHTVKNLEEKKAALDQMLPEPDEVYGEAPPLVKGFDKETEGKKEISEPEKEIPETKTEPEVAEITEPEVSQKEIYPTESKPETTKPPWEMTVDEFEKFAEGGKIHKATGKELPGEAEAKTPLAMGEINKYAPEDIARFYLQKHTGKDGTRTPEMVKAAHDELISDAVAEGRIEPAKAPEAVEGEKPWKVTRRVYQKTPGATRVPKDSILALKPEQITPENLSKYKNKDLEALSIVFNIPLSGNKNKKVERIVKALDVRQKLSEATEESLKAYTLPELTEMNLALTGREATYLNKAGKIKFLLAYRDKARSKGKMALANAKHFVAVKTALEEGQDIPEEVLKDYPDLKPTPSPEKTDVALERAGVVKSLQDEITSHITPSKGLERGLDYYKGKYEKFSDTELNKLLNWTRKQNKYIKERLGTNIAAEIRSRKPPTLAEKAIGKKPKISTKGQNVRTLRGYVNAVMGGINPLNFKGEVKELPLGSKYLFKKRGVPIDDAVRQLREDGWLNKNDTVATFLEKLRTDPKLVSRDRLGKDVFEKKESELTEEEKRFKKEMAWEPEEPPEGKYETIAVDKLKEGETYTIIEGRTRDGWGEYEIHKTKDGVTLEGGEILKLEPWDEVQVLKKELTKPSKADIKEDTLDKSFDQVKEALDIFGGKKPGQIEIWSMPKAEPEKKTRVKRKIKPPPRETQLDLFTGRQEQQIQSRLFQDFVKGGKKAVEKTSGEIQKPEAGTVEGAGRWVRTSPTGRVFEAPSLVASNESEIASLLSSIGKQARESLYTVTVDKNDNILEVFEHSRGTKTGSLAHPVEIAGHILNIPEATKVYYVHNHPSGDTNASKEDVVSEKSIGNILSLKDIQIESFVIGRNKWRPITYIPGAPEGIIKPVTGKEKIEVVESILTEGEPGETIDNSTKFKKVLKDKYGGKEGILFFGTNLHELGFMPWPAGESIKKASAQIIAAAESLNAAGYAITLNKPITYKNRAEFIRNFATNLNKHDLQLFEVLEQGKSYADTGILKAMTSRPNIAFKELLSEEPLYSFAGRKARTVDMSSLMDANVMQGQGVDMEAIRKKTGWFLDVDNHWKFEIDDSAIKLKLKLDSQKIGETNTFLGDAIKHPKLFQAYPELKGLLVHIMVDSDMQNPGGSLSQAVDRSAEGLFDLEPEMDVRAKDIDQAESILLHEIQHAIQNIEGFARGGNLESVKADIRQAAAVDADKIRTLAYHLGTLRDSDAMWKEETAYIEADMTEVALEKRNNSSVMKDWFKTWESIEALGKKYNIPATQFRKLALEKGRLISNDMIDSVSAFEQYKKLAGEVEARETALRKNLVAEQRKIIPPYLDGIPREDVIVKFRQEGPQYQAAEPKSKADKVFDTILPHLQGMTNFPTVQVVQSIDNLPKRLKDRVTSYSKKSNKQVEGFYDKTGDQVFLIADNLSEGRIEAVLRHEAEGHRGIRLLLGSELDGFLDGIAKAKKDELLKHDPKLNFKDQAAVRVAADEWCARKIEAGNLGKSFWDDLVRIFRKWMRKFVPNLDLSDGEIRSVLTDTVKNVREGRIDRIRTPEGKPIFSSIVKTNTAEFKKWFGDSKVVEGWSETGRATGKPLVVYHGSIADFEVFNTDADNQFGAHFAHSPTVASEFTGAEGGKVYPVYLSLQNPLALISDLGDWSDMDMLAEYLGEYNAEVFSDEEVDSFKTPNDVRKALIAKGYDGIYYQTSFEGKPDVHMGSTAQDVYIAFDPTQIKSVYNRGTFSETDPNIRHSSIADKWYSQMTKFVSDKLPGKSSPAQYKQMIQSWAKKGLIKKEELEWSGLNEWLDSQKGKVTKQQVLDYLAENNVRLEEVEKGVSYRDDEARRFHEDKAVDDTVNEVREILGRHNLLDNEVESAIDSWVESLGRDAQSEDFIDNYLGRATGDTIDGIFEDMLIASEEEGGAPSETKFHGYTLPGGERYKELLLVMPERARETEGLDSIAQRIFNKDFKDLPNESKETVRIQQRNIEKKSVQSPYKSSHWEEPNVIAHIRFDERTGPNGEKILNISEIQSDWGQEYRKQSQHIEKTVENDFKKIVKSMEKAGVLEEIC